MNGGNTLGSPTPSGTGRAATPDAGISFACASSG